MKSILFAIFCMSMNAFAFNGHENLKIHSVKPWGEFGYRVQGKGNHLKEIRFDCSKAEDIGLVLTIFNDYGKSSTVVMSTQKMNHDKVQCHAALKNYFSHYSKREVASLKKLNKHGTVELDFSSGGLFSAEEKTKAMKLR